jgi:hypothetical protein
LRANVFERIFQRTVQQCLRAGLVNGETVHVDSTLIRAQVSYASYSHRHGQKVWEENQAPSRKTSSSDPEAFFATDSRKEPPRPSYKQHTAVDDRKGIVVDVTVTTSDVNEGNHLGRQLDRIQINTGIKPQRITADSGYAHGHVLQSLEKAGIEPIIPPKPLASTTNPFPFTGSSMRPKTRSCAAHAARNSNVPIRTTPDGSISREPTIAEPVPCAAAA